MSHVEESATDESDLVSMAERFYQNQLADGRTPLNIVARAKRAIANGDEKFRSLFETLVANVPPAVLYGPKFNALTDERQAELLPRLEVLAGMTFGDPKDEVFQRIQLELNANMHRYSNHGRYIRGIALTYNPRCPDARIYNSLRYVQYLTASTAIYYLNTGDTQTKMSQQVSTLVQRLRALTTPDALSKPGTFMGIDLGESSRIYVSAIRRSVLGLPVIDRDTNVPYLAIYSYDREVKRELMNRLYDLLTQKRTAESTNFSIATALERAQRTAATRRDSFARKLITLLGVTSWEKPRARPYVSRFADDYDWLGARLESERHEPRQPFSEADFIAPQRVYNSCTVVQRGKSNVLLIDVFETDGVHYVPMMSFDQVLWVRSTTGHVASTTYHADVRDPATRKGVVVVAPVSGARSSKGRAKGPVFALSYTGSSTGLEWLKESSYARTDAVHAHFDDVVEGEQPHAMLGPSQDPITRTIEQYVEDAQAAGLNEVTLPITHPSLLPFMAVYARYKTDATPPASVFLAGQDGDVLRIKIELLDEYLGMLKQASTPQVESDDDNAPGNDIVVD